MMKLHKSLSTTLAMAALLALSACQQNEGPAERAGKELDRATVSAGQHLEDAGKKIQEEAKGDRK